MAGRIRAALVISLLAACLGNTSAQAADTPPVSLSVSVASAHGGTVTSDPAGISCPGTCTMTVPVGTQIALTGSGARPGLDFGHWNGACTGTQPYCTFAIDGRTKVGATFGPTPGWGVPRKVKSITDARKLYGPLKGFRYGPWLDATMFGGGADAVVSATNLKTGALSYISVYRCSAGESNPQQCVLASGSLTPITLAGRRVYTYPLGRGIGVLRLLERSLLSYDIIINATDSRDALEIMTQLNQVDR